MNNTSIFGSILKILTGGAAGQLIGFLALPLIAKLYGPETMGSYGIFLSLVSVVSILFSIRFEFFINSFSSMEDADRVFNLTVYISLLFFLTSTIIVIILSTMIDISSNFIYFLPISTFLAAIYQSATFYFVRKNKFGKIAISKGVYGASIAVLQLLSAIAALGAPYIVISHIVGQVIALSVLIVNCWRPSRPEKAHWELAKKILHPSLVLVLSGVINTTASTLPIIMIGNNFGATAAGWLALSQRLFATPLDLLGTSISQVFTGNIANPEIDELYKLKLFKKLTFIVAILSLASVVFSIILKNVTPMLLGEEWTGASQIILPIAFIYISRLIGNTFAQASVIARREKIVLVFDLFRLLSLAILFLFTNEDLETTIFIYCVIMVVFYILQYFLAANSMAWRYRSEV